MKILFYNHTGQVSGAERVLLMVLERLDRSCFNPVVICPAQSSLMKMIEDLGVSCETVGDLEARFTWRVDCLLRYLRSFYRVMRQLRERVIEVNPDLIHANSIRAGLVATAATIGLQVRVIWHMHDVLPRHPLSTAIRWFAVASTRTRMIAVSQAVADGFRGRVFNWVKSRAPVRVIHNGVEVKRFDPNPTGVQAVHDELGLSGSEFVVGIIGQLTPRKGQLELLNAFEKVLTEVPQAVLLVVGAPLFNRDHGYQLKLTQAADNLGIADRVRFLGARSDVAAIIQSLDLLVLSSRSEPFSLVLLEALASGTPVLATSVDGVPELIQHGETGWLVPPQNERALAMAIVNLSCQPELRAQFAERGRQHVHSHFSAEGYIRELEDFYQWIDRSRLRVKSERLVVES